MKNEDDVIRVINDCLKALLGSDEFVKQWWESPNLSFDMMTPANVVASGKTNLVLDYVLKHLSPGGH